jgi:hypothetical protein
MSVFFTGQPRFLLLITAVLISYGSKSQTVKQEVMIGNHRAIYDTKGMLLPWTSWQNAVNLEMQWYLHCPVTHGYPNFIWMTFMEGNYQPDIKRNDFIQVTWFIY